MREKAAVIVERFSKKTPSNAKRAFTVSRIGYLDNSVVFTFEKNCLQQWISLSTNATVCTVFHDVCSHAVSGCSKCEKTPFPQYCWLATTEELACFATALKYSRPSYCSELKKGLKRYSQKHKQVSDPTGAP